MPRPARATPAGVVLHVLTRGNDRAVVFHSPRDFDAFRDLLVVSRRRTPLDVLGWCLMPNHVHLVVRPHQSRDVPRFMQWLLATYAQRDRKSRGTPGHLWQGRYKSFPVQTDRQFVTVLRYVERNPVRAGLVPRAQDWRWSSVTERIGGVAPNLLTMSPIDLPTPWIDVVNEALTSKELARVRESVRRGRPLGEPGWEEVFAREVGLGSTIAPLGRPPKKKGSDPFRMPR